MIIHFRNFRIMQLLHPILLSVLLTACAPDLIVRDVHWDDTNKIGDAVIENIGNQNAGEFLVYFDAKENPESQNHRPQISLLVPNLPVGAPITLTADFQPSAHLDNNNLGNFHSITVRADPKNMIKESNENNNVMSSLASDKANFICHVTSGGFGVRASDGSGMGNGLSAFDLTLTIINTGSGNLGQLYINDFIATVFYPGSLTPAALVNEKVQLLNGRGSYDFNTGSFTNLTFDVLVTDATGNVISNATHIFSGSTSSPLTVPIGGASFTDVSVSFELADPFTIDMGNGFVGQFRLNTCPITSSEDIP